MKFFKQIKSTDTDYKNLLEVFAEIEIQSFGELSQCQQRELVAAWWSADCHEDERISILIDFNNSGAIAEMLYESISSKKAGDILFESIIDGEHIKSINIDMDEAFGDYMMSLDGYTSDEDELRIADNAERACGLNKVTHQRMGI